MSFHSSFSEHTGVNDVVLVSKNDVAFHFDLSFLGNLSSFFKDAATLPDSTRRMEFPEVPSVTLYLILHYLYDWARGRAPEKPLNREIPDLLDFAKQYEFPSIKQWVLSYFSAPDANPFESFAIAVLIGDQELVGQCAFYTTSHHLADIPDWVSDVLGERHPRALIWLYDFHIKELRAREKFHDDLENGTGHGSWFTDEGNEITRDGPGHHFDHERGVFRCAMRKSFDSLPAARKHISLKLQAKFTKNPCRMSSAFVRHVLQSEMPCAACLVDWLSFLVDWIGWDVNYSYVWPMPDDILE
ncbi:hypothetical protein BCR39DRAFT_556452 [Naematelia encephala]|uniref:BTB domain-containing protein n=1 Tax=Naematelia encephala TaxID=71784 RepID=A0A1Y2BJK3_9TREE|nr:hypothetical protein BCR39DRAFT_556452 [Naematelia encephala]